MRDNRVDTLRFVGLAMIILAHTNPPGILYQLRNFDVPLMVLVSGMAFGLSYTAKGTYNEYIWKRIKRLVFPVWIFLAAYFSLLFLLNPASEELKFITILTTFSLISGIGYVWIIKVFLLVAAVSPLIYLWHKKIQSNTLYFVMVAVGFLLNELLRYFSLPYIEEGAGKLISLVVFYLIPYSLIFGIGLRMLNMNKSHLYALSLTNLAVFLIIGLGLFFYKGTIVPTQDFKYPPAIYYFSYALFVSSLLWIYSEHLEVLFIKLKVERLILFMANNSIWIYLWHIPLIKIVNAHFVIKYPIVLVVAVSVTYLQTHIVNRLLINHARSNRLRKNIRILLTG